MSTLDKIGLAVAILILAAMVYPPLAADGDPSRWAARTSNVKQVDLGMIMYENDYDDRAPDMRTVAKFDKAVGPYVKSAQTLVDPQSKLPIEPNPQLSFVLAKDVQDPAVVVAVFSPVLERSRTRVTGYFDGHVSIPLEEDFIRRLMQTQSKISAAPKHSGSIRVPKKR